MKSQVGERVRERYNEPKPYSKRQAADDAISRKQGRFNKTKRKKTGRDGILGDQKLPETREKKVSANERTSERVDATVESKVE
jgi:hypothetical protein